MQKKTSEMVVELLNAHKNAHGYEWSIEVRNLGSMKGDDYYVFVLPKLPAFYSGELKDLVCVASAFRVSYWCGATTDGRDYQKPEFVLS